MGEPNSEYHMSHLEILRKTFFKIYIVLGIIKISLYFHDIIIINVLIVIKNIIMVGQN